MTSMQVVVDGLLTQYSQEGTGKVVLVLHGWGDNSRGLSGLVHSLAQKYCVINLDLPGFGGSQTPSGAWGLTAYAKFVVHFLHKISINKVYAVVGHSNGGAIAIRAVGLHLLSTERLILLASAGIRNRNKGKNTVLRLITKTGKVLTLPLPAATKRRLRKAVYKKVGSDMLVAEHMQDSFKKIVGDDVQNDAKQLDLPVLLVYGEDDTATPPLYGQQFHELIHDSSLAILPAAGHFVHLDQPKTVTSLLTEFLS